MHTHTCRLHGRKGFRIAEEKQLGPAVEKTEQLLNNLKLELRTRGDGLRGEGLRETGVERLSHVFSSNNRLGWRLDRWGNGEEVWACLHVFRNIEGFSVRGP